MEIYFGTQINPSRRKGVSGGKDIRMAENEGKKNMQTMENMEEEGEEERGSLEDFVLETFESEELPQSDYNTLGLIRSGKVFAQSHVGLSY